MIADIEKLANLGGTVITVLLFLYYLNKKDESINKVINNHLEHSGRIIDKNSEALTQVKVTLKELCMVIKKNGRKK